MTKDRRDAIARLRNLEHALHAIVEGFELEALNGVICLPRDSQEAVKCSDDSSPHFTKERNCMKRNVLFVLVSLLLAAVPALAQPPTSYTLVVNTGATVVSTTVITAANFTCNQAPPTTTTTVNPNKIWFTDPNNVGQACVFTDNGTTGPLSSLPFGAAIYTATLVATNSAGSSPVSAPSNSFTHPGAVLSAPMGLTVGR